MKIAVITIYDLVGNYGNKLQNYALVHLLKEKGYAVDTLVVEKERPYLFLKGASILNRLFNYRWSKGQLYWLRSLSTRKFEKKYLSPSYKLLKGKDISKDYEYYVVGSDQVWNPNWYNDLKKEVFLLTFVEDEKKVCIAPSFGISELPENWKEWFKKHLSTFPQISVREEDGAKIIKELTGKDAEILIDPTLMLSALEWKEISERPKMVDFNQEYILTYFLGGKGDKAKKEIRSFCEKYCLREYDLQELNGHSPYAANPGQFIYMIEHAKLIMTDSFHACVFSFLFNKPFLVYKREGAEMFSRIESLLNRFDLQRKYVDSGLKNEVFECDYQKGFESLSVEKKRFEKFLERQIRGTDNG